ncbi:hypothetical protein DL763_003403 [Monosporascus cannonballus]|nr:hypothetical protein DL763_003403 [Monosporascus cannonballus]
MDPDVHDGPPQQPRQLREGVTQRLRTGTGFPGCAVPQSSRWRVKLDSVSVEGTTRTIVVEVVASSFEQHITFIPEWAEKTVAEGLNVQIAACLSAVDELDMDIVFQDLVRRRMPSSFIHDASADGLASLRHQDLIHMVPLPRRAPQPVQGASEDMPFVNTPETDDRIPENDAIFGIFNSSSLDFELARLLGSASAGECDVVEFLEAVGKIRPHDPDPWFAARHGQSLRAARGSPKTRRTAAGPPRRAPSWVTSCPHWRGRHVGVGTDRDELPRALGVRPGHGRDSTGTPGDTLPRFRSSSLDYVPEVAEWPRVVDPVQCPVMLTGPLRSVYASALQFLDKHLGAHRGRAKVGMV